MKIDGEYPRGYSHVMALTVLQAAALLGVAVENMHGFINKGWHSVGFMGAINERHSKAMLLEWRGRNDKLLFKVPDENLLAIYNHDGEYFLIKFNGKGK